MREQGCDEVQGFLFSRPLPAEECRALLLRQTFRQEQLESERVVAAG